MISRGAAAALASGALLALAGCRPDTTTGTQRGELKLTVPGGSPAIETAWDFGTVTLGSSKVVDLQASNTGLDPVAIVSVRFEVADSGAYFVRGAPSKLEAGASAPFSVTYAPTRAAAQTGRLVLEHDGQSAAAVVALNGQGVN